MHKRKKKELVIYTLTTFQEGMVLCVCTSIKKLEEAISYWMNERPLTTMSYLEWTPNYVHEPNSWGWAYISPSANLDHLEEGGGWGPPKEIWGINLLEIDTQPYYNAWHDEMMKGFYSHDQDSKDS